MKKILEQKNQDYIPFNRSKPLNDKNYKEIKCYKNKVLIKSVRKHKEKDKIRIMIYPKTGTKYEKLNRRLLNLLERIIRSKYNFMRKKKMKIKTFLI